MYPFLTKEEIDYKIASFFFSGDIRDSGAAFVLYFDNEKKLIKTVTELDRVLVEMNYVVKEKIEVLGDIKIPDKYNRSNRLFYTNDRDINGKYLHKEERVVILEKIRNREDNPFKNCK